VTPGFDGVFAVGARYLLWPDPTDSKAVLIIRRSDGGVVRKHRAGPRGFEPDFGGIHGDRAVIADEDVQSPDARKPNARASIYDLANGRVVEVGKIPGAPALSKYGPQATISADGKYYYSASIGGGLSNCVGEVDLVRQRGRVVECAGSKGMILYVGSGDRGATWTRFAERSFAACRVGRGIHDGRLFTLAPRTCDAFGTAAVEGGWSLRTRQPRDEAIQPAMPLTATRGRERVDLGEARGRSVVACAGYAYWKHDVPDESAQEIRRWRPGGAVELVYRQPAPAPDSRETTLLTTGGCNDGLFTFTVVAHANGRFDATVYSFP
jgi:hypothetical protein